MTTTWQDLIDRARTYVDDDHQDEDSWITPERWLTFFNVEYGQLYRKWMQASLVQPAVTQAAMTGSSMTLSGVLALVGVAEDLGGSVRVLTPAQPHWGENAGWKSTTEAQGIARTYTATGFGDSLTLELRPNDTNYANYLVRYVPAPTYATSVSASVTLPFGGDERLVLGAARRAGIKDSTVSREVREQIADFDAQLNMQAWGQIPGGPRVRRNLPTRLSRTFTTNPRDWFYTPGVLLA